MAFAKLPVKAEAAAAHGSLPCTARGPWRAEHDCAVRIWTRRRTRPGDEGRDGSAAARTAEGQRTCEILGNADGCGVNSPACEGGLRVVSRFSFDLTRMLLSHAGRCSVLPPIATRTPSDAVLAPECTPAPPKLDHVRTHVFLLPTNSLAGLRGMAQGTLVRPSHSPCGAWPSPCLAVVLRRSSHSCPRPHIAFS